MLSTKFIITAIALVFATFTKTAIAGTSCGIEYYLWNADTDKVVKKLPSKIDMSYHKYKFSIEARPTGGCKAESAYLKLSGPILYTRVENRGPYLLFGDSGKNVAGRKMKEGWYIIYTKLYTEDNQGGTGIASRLYKFQITK